MNSFLRRLALFSLSGLLTTSLAQAGDSAAQSPQQLAAASAANRSNNNSDNGAIRRANPNSRQGTQSISPTPRGPNLNPAPQRSPTLENGGIGNGYPTRQSAPRPSSGNERGSN
ncbi:hypothetical protein [Pseudomonas bohemica]|uniref:hypothetical protein n=1 Tax=Pseudomonas bohemica TaxID=2044872 RepID=UPI000DA61567|nr:hypothetical protein [Pseudomonas bohemica]